MFFLIICVHVLGLNNRNLELLFSPAQLSKVKSKPKDSNGITVPNIKSLNAIAEGRLNEKLNEHYTARALGVIAPELFCRE